MFPIKRTIFFTTVTLYYFVYEKLPIKLETLKLVLPILLDHRSHFVRASHGVNNLDHHLESATLDFFLRESVY